MLGTIGLLIKNAPAIITEIQAFTPDNVDKALNKVKTGALVAGAVATGVSQPWTVESGLRALCEAVLMAIGVPYDVASPAAPVLATVATFLGSAAATYITGWATREDADKLKKVQAG